MATKSVVVGVRLTPAEAARFDELCREADRDRATLLRRIISMAVIEPEVLRLVEPVAREREA